MSMSINTPILAGSNTFLAKYRGGQPNRPSNCPVECASELCLVHNPNGAMDSMDTL